MSERLFALGIDRAKCDVDRAILLGEIKRFAESIGDAQLVAEAQAAMPAASPFFPPEEWKRALQRPRRGEKMGVRTPKHSTRHSKKTLGRNVAMSETRACQGAKTDDCRLSDMGHAQQCRFCGMKVRHDMVDDPFFGFAAGCQGESAEEQRDFERECELNAIHYRSNVV